ncbi:MAG: hypothetical protein JNM88_14475 [Chitinophagaceae bacterium]|nr:hypothetical protein [Chitinophagaceae bacterium]
MQKKYSLAYSVTSLFILLGILFIAFPFYLFPYQQQITEKIFGPLIGFTARQVFDIPPKSTLVHSDAVAMYVLVLLLFLLAILLALLMRYVQGVKRWESKVLSIIRVVACYYLALMLMKYGLDKVFKAQFYLPEPNTLYTPLGMVDKDLLYWSSMGTSRFYNICMGGAEVLAALLLLFRRTRMAGILLSIAIMAQVVMINFGFDISVKVYSLFLLFIGLYLLHPYYRRLYHFLFLGKNETRPTVELSFIRQPFVYVFLKCLVAGIILLESFYPYMRRGNYNDDTAARPYLHGAYQVTGMIAGGDTLQPAAFPVKRFFVHRRGYLIFQDQQDKMQDFHFTYNKQTNAFIITDYQLREIPLRVQYDAADSVITLQFMKDSVPVQLTGKGLNWRQLPALRKLFHFTVD